MKVLTLTLKINKHYATERINKFLEYATLGSFFI